MQYLLKSPLTCIQDERLGNVIYHADHLKAHKIENDVRMLMLFCLTFDRLVLQFCRQITFEIIMFSLPYRYHTITLGVDPGYSGENFYSHILSKDTQRVIDRFDAAQDRGITVAQTSTDTADIIQHLAKHGLVIVLTDANLLR